MVQKLTVTPGDILLLGINRTLFRSELPTAEVHLYIQITGAQGPECCYLSEPHFDRNSLPMDSDGK